MATKTQRAILEIGIILALVLVLAAVLWLILACARREARQSSCQRNMHNLDLSLSAYCYPPVSNYPSRLTELAPDKVVANMLLCPAMMFDHVIDSNNCGKQLAETDDYIDYIYVADLGPAAPLGIPLLICPPENHGGRGGNVLYTGHSIRWVEASDMGKLIDWTYAYARSNGLDVIVSTALTERSKGRYKSWKSQKGHSSRTGSSSQSTNRLRDESNAQIGSDLETRK